MWRLIEACFRTSPNDLAQQPHHRAPPEPAAYQAPVVTPSPRASGSVSSVDEDQDYEHGTLLPKRRALEPGGRGINTGGGGSSGAASSAAAAAVTVTAAASAAAATAAAAAAAAAAAPPEVADAAAQEPRHRRTGSDGPRVHVEGVHARVLTSAVAAKAKFGTTEAEFAAVAELLGTDAEDDDFCPTCLEAYTDDNPKIFTRCGHAFHMQCIYAWLERSATCPLCESPMTLQADILL